LLVSITTGTALAPVVTPLIPVIYEAVCTDDPILMALFSAATPVLPIKILKLSAAV